jgi:hypothetical protein
MLRKRLHVSSWIAILLRLDLFKTYRRWQGRHWEFWWVDVPVCSYVWHQLDSCTQQPQPELSSDFYKGKSLNSVLRNVCRDRPTPLCKGTPICEDYTDVSDPLDAEFING